MTYVDAIIIIFTLALFGAMVSVFIWVAVVAWIDIARRWRKYRE